MNNLLYRLINRYMAWAGMMLYAFDPNDPEDKAALESAIAEQVAGLKAKNQELIAELREAKKGRQVDPAEVQRLEDQVEALTAERDGLAKQVKDGAKALEKATAAHAEESAFTKRLLVDQGLTEALVKAGVAAPYLPGARAMLAGQVQVITEGAERRAMVGDKPLADFVASWAAGDEGKHYVAAPNNSGGGASGGSNGGGAAKVATRAEFSAMTPDAQMAHVKGGGTVTD